MANLSSFWMVLGFLSEYMLQYAHRAGYLKEVEPVDLPNFHLVQGIDYGSDDIHVLPNGLAFVSSGLKFPGLKSFAPSRPAEILLLDLNDDVLHAKPLQLGEGVNAFSFNPHGLSAYIDEKDGAVYLFVVNHPLPVYSSTIEIFKFDVKQKSLQHMKTITHPLLHSLNDLVAVGPESFYATNHQHFQFTPLRLTEGFFGLKLTNVVYYSPGDVRVVASGLYSANGITLSTNNEFLYAADLLGHTVNVYQKHSNWTLTPVKAIDIDTCVDNLSVDPVTGDIWTAGHPNLFKVQDYKDEDPPASEVIRIKDIHSDNPIVTRVYVNNGSVIQAASVATVYKKKLIIGTLFHKALYCQLD